MTFYRSLVKSKIMPVLVESEEEEDGDADCKDPLPEKLQSSMVRILHTLSDNWKPLNF